MPEYGLIPGWTIKDLISANLSVGLATPITTGPDGAMYCRPVQLVWLKYEQCEDFVFHESFGHEAAFEQVSEYGDCKGIKLEWVKNHYGLIVWKLAGIARAKPDEWQDWFSFEKVCEQLQYRYEREVLLSHRSCIKRIQERDSSASIAMCLVVTRILCEERQMAPEIGSVEEQQGQAIKQMWPAQLELTDGWYKIKANLDPVLEQAALMQNLVSGSKILIQGAKVCFILARLSCIS